ncbi:MULTISPECIES: hypothetical protein [Streptomyces]|uniref:Lipoprotein n=1 Tax=Streptomyces chartreusis NRRL 3882 TaxID=1079985 RepID=A0A2N9BLJ9_STRCX|nr:MULTISPECIES: hypothetical protein [Streptomyces]MYS88622.1 hypothetical protein [Streptomyces sp. SID5464]SOR84243.1 hypothetical protein SCNRRL3882_7688 [Streptomyces chartreusis NRRL 3882]
MSGRRRTPGIVAVVVLVTAGACGTPSERRDSVTAQVTRFERALDTGQRERLCTALAPSTREELEQSAKRSCAQAIGEQGLPAAGAVRRVDVYGDQARVVLEHDTLFLARFPAGWKVTAAGCRPRPQRPYQCEIEGG